MSAPKIAAVKMMGMFCLFYLTKELSEIWHIETSKYELYTGNRNKKFLQNPLSSPYCTIYTIIFEVWDIRYGECNNVYARDNVCVADTVYKERCLQIPAIYIML